MEYIEVSVALDMYLFIVSAKGLSATNTVRRDRNYDFLACALFFDAMSDVRRVPPSPPFFSRSFELIHYR